MLVLVGFQMCFCFVFLFACVSENKVPMFSMMDKNVDHGLRYLV